MSNFPAPSLTWGDVTRLCRRICVLRERGLEAEAEKIRAELLPPMLARVRQPDETEAILAARVEATFAQETERVAHAAVLAELLRPMLTDQATALAPPTPVLEPIVIGVSPIAKIPDPLPKAPVRKAASIADFIDEMILQENPPPRPNDNQRRRAS